MRSAIESIFSSLSRTLYRGPVKRASKRAGLEGPLKRLYRRVVSDEMRTHTVESVTADFYNTEHIPSALPEREVFADVLGRLDPDDIFYDLGANRGLYTCLVGNKLTDGAVVSFEPNPHAADRLEANVTLNGLGERVELFRVATAASDGEAEFVVRSGSTGNTLAVDTAESEDETIAVETVAVDALVEREGLPTPSVVKIDVEGAEFEAITGMERTLGDDGCRTLYCEVHAKSGDVSVGAHGMETFGHGVGEMAEKLRTLGFTDIETLYTRSDNHYILRASKPGIDPAETTH